MEYGRNLHRTSKDSHIITKASSTSTSSSSSSSSGSDGHRINSRRPPRPVPVIRVVHIFNPTVIKTDAANFRSLVQELTGRSCSGDKGVTTKSRQRCLSVAQPDIMVVAPQKFPSVPKRNAMYIPERLGNLSDIDIMSSFQEPAGVMDLSSMLPTLGDINDDNLLPRFPSLYESF